MVIWGHDQSCTVMIGHDRDRDALRRSRSRSLKKRGSMINADNRLITEVLPKIGADAFSIAFAITSHLRSKNRTAWPGLERLREMCPVEINGKIRSMPEKRAYAAIRRLIREGVVQRWQDNCAGEFGHTRYRLTTPYLSIFMGVSEFTMEEEDRTVEFDRTDGKFRVAQNRVAQNDHTEYIDKKEAIDKKESLEAPAKEGGSNSKARLRNSQIGVLETVEVKEQLREKFPEAELERELERMIDYCKAHGKRYKDYIAFARNWLRRQRSASGEERRPDSRIVDMKVSRDILALRDEMFTTDG